MTSALKVWKCLSFYVAMLINIFEREGNYICFRFSWKIFHSIWKFYKLSPNNSMMHNIFNRDENCININMEINKYLFISMSNQSFICLNTLNDRKINNMKPIRRLFMLIQIRNQHLFSFTVNQSKTPLHTVMYTWFDYVISILNILDKLIARKDSSRGLWHHFSDIWKWGGCFVVYFSKRKLITNLFFFLSPHPW